MKMLSPLKSLMLGLALISFLSIPFSVFAHDSTPFLGTWTGSISIMGQKYEITVKFNLDKNKEISGTIDIPVQGAMGLELTDIKIDGKKISFMIALPATQGQPTFKGELDETGKKIAGDFTQSGYEGTFALEKK